MKALVKLQRLQEAQDTLMEMRQKHVQPLLGFGFERSVSDMTLVSLQIMKYWRVEWTVNDFAKEFDHLHLFAKRLCQERQKWDSSAIALVGTVNYVALMCSMLVFELEVYWYQIAPKWSHPRLLEESNQCQDWKGLGNGLVDAVAARVIARPFLLDFASD